MPLILLLLAGLLLSQTCGAQPDPDLAKLGWFEAGRGYTAHQGRIGAIGGNAEAPADLDRLPSFEALAVLRNSGAATFATPLHAALPFDLAAAKLVDGLIITEGGERALALWSLLLDHGYALSPMAAGEARLYVHCPGGLSAACLSEAVRRQGTIVSTGPILTAARVGKQIEVNAWPRQGRPDHLLRIELWAHNRVIATRQITGSESQHFAGTLAWTPEGPDDWVAVRAIAESGWAMSSAFFAEDRKPSPAITTHVKMVFPEIASQQQAGALATIWDFSPSLPGAKKIQEVEMERNELEVDAPATAVIRIELADGRRIDTRLSEASGVRALLQDSGGEDGLLQWSTYEEVLRRSRRVSIESRF